MTTVKFRPAGSKGSEDLAIDVSGLNDIKALQDAIGKTLGVIQPEGIKSFKMFLSVQPRLTIS